MKWCESGEARGVTIISASNNFILMHFNELLLCCQPSFTPQLASTLSGNENFLAFLLLLISAVVSIKKFALNVFSSLLSPLDDIFTFLLIQMTIGDN